MLIYRYENKKGKGPFTHDLDTDEDMALCNILYSSINPTLHPTPNHNLYTLGEGVSEYHFGCASREEIDHWFNEEVKKCLEDAGFRLKIYDCPDEYCVREENQIGFLKCEAEDITNSMREFVLV
jgi:hypothetical protein